MIVGVSVSAAEVARVLGSRKRETTPFREPIAMVLLLASRAIDSRGVVPAERTRRGVTEAGEAREITEVVPLVCAAMRTRLERSSSGVASGAEG